jgi:hypothetical protein
MICDSKGNGHVKVIDDKDNPVRGLYAGGWESVTKQEYRVDI